MALTKHMAGSDLLKIRKLMKLGIMDVATIQQDVKIHSERIQHVIDVGLDGPAAAQAAAAAADKVELANAKVVRAQHDAQVAATAAAALVPASPVVVAEDILDPASAPVVVAEDILDPASAPAPAKPTAAEKAKAKAAKAKAAKAAKAVDPLS